VKHNNANSRAHFNCAAPREHNEGYRLQSPRVHVVCTCRVYGVFHPLTNSTYIAHATCACAHIPHIYRQTGDRSNAKGHRHRGTGSGTATADRRCTQDARPAFGAMGASSCGRQKCCCEYRH
jgi:hypothetical protein